MKQQSIQTGKNELNIDITAVEMRGCDLMKALNIENYESLYELLLIANNVKGFRVHAYPLYKYDKITFSYENDMDINKIDIKEIDMGVIAKRQLARLKQQQKDRYQPWETEYNA